MSSKGQRLPTTTDALVRRRSDTRDLYALNRSRITTRTIQPPPRSGVPSQGSSSTASGTGLRTSGDTMIGAIAFFPVDADILNDEINIGATGNSPSDFSTYVRLLPEGGVADDLLSILGATFAGQLLYLQGADNITTTLIDADSTSGNIITGEDGLTLTGGQVMTLMFDPTADLGNAGVDGYWRVVAGGSPEEASLVVLNRLTNQALNGTGVTVIEYNNNFFFGDDEKITATPTAGVFKLLAGFIYRANALGAIELTDTGAGSSGIARWEVSLTETGIFSEILAGVLEEAGQIRGVFNAGRATFTTQSQAIALVIDATNQDIFIRQVIDGISGTLIDYLAGASGATIETVGLGGGGGGGSGGSDTLGGLSDVTLTNLTQDDIIVYNSTSGQWENQGQSASSQTPWQSNIVGNGYNLDMSSNIARQTPSLFGMKTVTVAFWDGVTAVQKATFLAETDRAEINIVDPIDDFLLKSDGSTKFGYFGENDDQLRFFVRMDAQQQRISNLQSVTFSPTVDSIAAQTAGIFEKLTDGDLEYRSNVGHIFESNAGGIPQPRLLDIQGIVGLTGGLVSEIGKSSYIAQVNFIGALSNNGDFVLGDDSNMYVVSGNAIRNLSDIGTGGSSDRIQSPDTLTDIVATDGTLQMRISGTVRWTMNSVGLNLDRNLIMNANTINSVGGIFPNTGSATIGDDASFFGQISGTKFTVGEAGNTLTFNTGIEYTLATTGLVHDFIIVTGSKLRISNTAISIFEDTNFNNNDVTGIDDMTMNGIGSQIRMQGGDILLAGGDISQVDLFSMQGQATIFDVENIVMNANSTNSIVNVGDLSMFGGASVIDLKNGDIDNVDEIRFKSAGNNGIDLDGGQIQNAGDVEIDGDLNHDGTEIGFFGTPTAIQQTVPSDTLANLYTALRNYGLIA